MLLTVVIDMFTLLLLLLPLLFCLLVCVWLRVLALENKGSDTPAATILGQCWPVSFLRKRRGGKGGGKGGGEGRRSVRQRGGSRREGWGQASS